MRPGCSRSELCLPRWGKVARSDGWGVLIRYRFSSVARKSSLIACTKYFFLYQIWQISFVFWIFAIYTQNEVLYWVCFGRFSLREKRYLIRRLIRRFAAPICLQIAPHGEDWYRVCEHSFLLFVHFAIWLIILILCQWSEFREKSRNFLILYILVCRSCNTDSVLLIRQPAAATICLQIATHGEGLYSDCEH